MKFKNKKIEINISASFVMALKEHHFFRNTDGMESFL
jgi:hypothetical protein